MRNKKNISILGCGWLGFPLATKLIQLGWHVKGTTTSKEKTADMRLAGIEAYELRLPDINPDGLGVFSSEILLINIPPGRGKTANIGKYGHSISEMLQHAKNAQKLIFISSTSVYGSHADHIDETSETMPESPSGRSILKAEKQIMASKIPYFILRFGGLAGPGRHPGRFLSGKTGLPNAHQSINFLHQDDAIGAIISMLHNDLSNEIFNVVAPIHPTKIDFYNKMADDIGLERPEFLDDSLANKREISCSKLLRMTDFTFNYPDPMHFMF